MDDEHSAPEMITVDGNAFAKHSDGSLIKLNNDDYDDESNLIYRYANPLIKPLALQ